MQEPNVRQSRSTKAKAKPGRKPTGRNFILYCRIQKTNLDFFKSLCREHGVTLSSGLDLTIDRLRTGRIKMTALKAA